MDVTDNEYELLMRESGLRTKVKNQGSTAKGIWQGTLGTRIAYANMHGFDPETTNDREQLIMFRSYYQITYSTAKRALDFQKATTSMQVELAPPDLRAKAQDWINKGYKGY